MEQAYAQALWTAVEQGKEPGAAVRALTAILERTGREALLPRIGKAFSRIAEREQRTNGLTLYVAREKDARAAATAAAGAIQALGTLATEFDVRIDDSLIGGWRLEGASILVDHSYRQQLLSIYQRAVEH